MLDMLLSACDNIAVSREEHNSITCVIGKILRTIKKSVNFDQLVETEHKTRPTLAWKINNLKQSIMDNCVDPNCMTLLVNQLDNDKYELLEGYHRVQACKALFDSPNNKHCVNLLISNGQLNFVVEVLPMDSSRTIMTNMALRSNIVNETAIAMQWHDYVNKMLTFSYSEIKNQNTFKNIWVAKTSILLAAHDYTRLRRIAKWILINDAKQLWKSLNARVKLARSAFDHLFKLKAAPPFIGQICLFSLYCGENKDIKKLAALFSSLDYGDVIQCVKYAIQCRFEIWGILSKYKNGRSLTGVDGNVDQRALKYSCEKATKAKMIKLCDDVSCVTCQHVYDTLDASDIAHVLLRVCVPPLSLCAYK